MIIIKIVIAIPKTTAIIVSSKLSIDPAININMKVFHNYSHFIIRTRPEINSA